MAVKIRLRRMGAHKKPFYRVVVADSRSPRDGKCIEEIGFFNPMVEPAEIKLDMEKVEKWIANGAQPTDRVKSIIKGLKEAADESASDAAGTENTEESTGDEAQDTAASVENDSADSASEKDTETSAEAQNDSTIDTEGIYD